jgi:hypothetical protein
MRGVWMTVGLVAVLGAPLAAQDSLVPTECVDRTERPIQGVIDNTLAYAGVATVLPDGTPVIYLNQDVLKKATPLARRFILLHECAHHHLRHVYRDPSRTLEIEADCWAIQYLVEHDIVKERHVDELQAELGPSRGIGDLRGCLAVKADPALWRRSLDLLTRAGARKFAPIRGAPIREDPERGFFESTLDLPGTFGCELTPADAFSCEVFHGKDDGPTTTRYETIRDIIQDWLPETWLTFERVDPRPEERRRFVAQRITTGAQMTLVATADHRILFRFEAPP